VDRMIRLLLTRDSRSCSVPSLLALAAGSPGSGDYCSETKKTTGRRMGRVDAVSTLGDGSQESIPTPDNGRPKRSFADRTCRLLPQRTPEGKNTNTVMTKCSTTHLQGTLAAPTRGRPADETREFF
jgi:hypothetical protein